MFFIMISHIRIAGIGLNWPKLDSGKECYRILKDGQSRKDTSNFITTWP
jgi:hypothetical protein